MCVWVGHCPPPPSLSGSVFGLIVFIFLGKDRVIFVTKEDHEAPSNAELVEDDPNDPYEDHGQLMTLTSLVN